MSRITNVNGYEKAVKERMKAVLSHKHITQCTAAARMGFSPSAFSRRIDPEGNQRLMLEFCFKFASTFCSGDIASLISTETDNDDAIGKAFDMGRIFNGLPADIQQGIYDRAVSEGDAFRKALLKK